MKSKKKSKKIAEAIGASRVIKLKSKFHFPIDALGQSYVTSFSAGIKSNLYTN